MARAPQPEQHTSSAWRARKYLLVTMLPIFTFVGVLVAWGLLSLLPGRLASIVFAVTWLASLFHAARQSRAGWVVGMVVCWPGIVAYWIYVSLRLAEPGPLHRG